MEIEKIQKETPWVDHFDEIIGNKFPFFQNAVHNQQEKFGDSWRNEFDNLLAKVFNTDPDKMERAAGGYIEFALDGIRLQKRFEKERTYIHKTYDQACRETYFNEEYMMNVNLPGNLISHYIWPHHYRQLLFFKEKFLPLINDSEDPRFVDVGIGTGFYSLQMLQGSRSMTGRGFDVSPFSLKFTDSLVKTFGFQNRYQLFKRDILTDPPDEQASFMVNVEVLEHLEDPLHFLKALRKLLKPGGKGFVSAAITAPSQEHIYLYNNAGEVLAHLKQAEFSVINFSEEKAYEPKGSEPVPRNGFFIIE